MRRVLLAFAVVAPLLSSCGGSESSGPADRTPASVVLEPASSVIVLGKTEQLTAQAYNAGGDAISAVEISWGTNGSPSAVLDPNHPGLVHGFATGTAWIYARVSGNAALVDSAEVAVVEGIVASVTVTGLPGTMLVGSEAYVFADVRDASGDGISVGVTWSSSDPARLKVHPTGQVEALAPGLVTITATPVTGSVTGTAQTTVVAEPGT